MSARTIDRLNLNLAFTDAIQFIRIQRDYRVLSVENIADQMLTIFYTSEQGQDPQDMVSRALLVLPTFSYVPNPELFEYIGTAVGSEHDVYHVYLAKCEIH